MSRDALLIGIGDYSFDLESLPASSKDAEALSSVLESPNLCRFQSVKILNEGSASSSEFWAQEVADALGSWCDRHHPDDLVLLYISGHLLWDQSGELHLAVPATFTGSGQMSWARTVDFSFIRSRLEESAAQRQIVIVDGCIGEWAIAHRPQSAFTKSRPSGSEPESESESEDRSAQLPQASLNWEQRLGSDRRVVLAASGVATASGNYFPDHKQNPNRPSLFTHCLTEGIRTGLADRNQDGQISLDELHEFVAAQMAIVTPAISPILTSSAEGLGAIALAAANISESHHTYYQKVQERLQQYGDDFVNVLTSASQSQTGDSSPHLGWQSLRQLQRRLDLSPKIATSICQTALSRYAQRRYHLAQYRQGAEQFLAQEAQADASFARSSVLRRATVQQNDDDDSAKEGSDAYDTEDEVLMPGKDMEEWEVKDVHDYLDASFPDTVNHPANTRSQPFSDCSESSNGASSKKDTSGNDASEPDASEPNALEPDASKPDASSENTSGENNGSSSSPSPAVTRAQLQRLRDRLGLQQADVAELDQAIDYILHLHRLSLYRQIYTQAPQIEHPLNETDQQVLANLRQDLQLSDEEDAVRQVEQECLAYDEAHQQTQRQYRITFSDALQRGLAEQSSVRRALKRFQQSLGLSNATVNQIETEVQHQWDASGADADAESTDSASSSSESTHLDSEPAHEDSRSHSDSHSDSMTESTPKPAPNPASGGDRQQRHKEYRDAFTAAARERIPIPSSVLDALRRLQQMLKIEDDVAEDIQREVMHTIRDEANHHNRNRADYARDFEQTVAESFPISEQERSRLDSLRQSLGLSEEEVKPIEQMIERQWQSQHEADTHPPHLPDESATEAATDSGFNSGPDSGTDSEDSASSDQTDASDQDESSNDAVPQPNPFLAEANGHSPDSQTLDVEALGNPEQRLDQPDASLSDPTHEFDKEVEATADDQTHDSAEASTEPAAADSQEDGAPVPPVTEADLAVASERGINYDDLRQCLHDGQWQTADDLTHQILLRLGHDEPNKNDWVNRQAIANLPATDLQTIDRLWVEYSQGNFGFSVQARIYFNSDPNQSIVNGNALAFGKVVDWVQLDQDLLGFKFYNQLKFDLFQVEEGHLPAKWFWAIPWWESLKLGGVGTGRGGCGDDGGILFTFMSKLMTCGVIS